MAAITVQQISTSGLTPSAGVAAGASGDTVINNGKTYIEVVDTGTTAPTVTITGQTSCNQGSTHDITVAISSGSSALIGPFNQNWYNNSTGSIEVSYSSETDVTIAAFSL